MTTPSTHSYKAEIELLEDLDAFKESLPHGSPLIGQLDTMLDKWWERADSKQKDTIVLKIMIDDSNDATIVWTNYDGSKLDYESFYGGDYGCCGSCGVVGEWHEIICGDCDLCYTEHCTCNQEPDEPRIRIVKDFLKYKAGEVYDWEDFDSPGNYVYCYPYSEPDTYGGNYTERIITLDQNTDSWELTWDPAHDPNEEENLRKFNEWLTERAKLNRN